jgi:hypothetical protein
VYKDVFRVDKMLLIKHEHFNGKHIYIQKHNTNEISVDVPLSYSLKMTHTIKVLPL